MINDCQLVWMRKMVEKTFRQTVKILALTSIEDNTGGNDEIYTVVSTCKGRLTPVKQTELERGKEERNSDLWELRLPFGTVLLTEHRVQVETVEYSVSGTDAGRADAVFLLAQIQRVKI